MRFGEYLVSQGKIGEKEILEAIAQQRSYHKVIGQLAIEMNLLSPRDVARIRGIQRSEGKKFGEIAINLNLLTSEQVESLLKVQKGDHQFIGKILVTQGQMTPEELVAELRKFSAVKKLKKTRGPRVILAASASAEDRQTIVDDFDPARYRVLEALDGEKTIGMAREHKPELIVMDRDCPAQGGYEVCRLLRGEPGTRYIPVLMLTRHPEEVDSALGFKVGVADHFLYPFRKGSLERFAHKLLELHETAKEHLLLIVDDNPMTRHSLKYLLLPEGFDVIDLESADDVLQNVTEEVDCIIFAVEPPNEGSLRVAREVCERRVADYVPMVFIVTEETRKDVMPLLSAGITDLVVRPFGQEELVARLRCHAVHKRLVDRLDLQKELLQIQKVELEETNRESRELLSKWKLGYRGYRRILDSITDSIVVIDTEYRIQAANPAALKALGVEREQDTVGVPCYRLFTGTDRVCEDCAAKRVLDTGEAVRGLRPWTMPGGGRREMEESAFPVLSSKGQVISVVVYARTVEEGDAARR
ncbi:MAG: response regulator [Deltaproteobacteria bacterium]|nr:response regulator [Deltaproteobacteria bacterium]